MATSRKTAAKKTAKKTVSRDANKWASVQVPEGYTPIASGEFGEQWEFEANPVLVGTIDGDVRDVTVNEGKRGAYDTRAVTIKDENGARFDVWESASLKGWFDEIADGMSVAVVFQGYRDVGKASLMKVFVGSIAQDDKPARRTAAKKRRG